MTIEEIKIIYESMKASGQDVLKLKGDDETVRCLRAIARVQKILDDYSNSGGDVFMLTKKDQAYRTVKDINMTLNGKRVPLVTRFELTGYKKNIRKAPTIDELRESLQSFVDAGCKIEDLRQLNFDLYNNVRNSRYLNGTVDERIRFLGFFKPKTKSASVEFDVKQDINKQLEEGKNIYEIVELDDIKAKLWVVMRKYRRRGIKLSKEEILQKLGYDYSETFVHFDKLFELQNFRDEKGFVDSYRKNVIVDGAIDRYAKELDMPIAAVVELVANENLKRVPFPVDVIEFVKKQLDDHIKRYGSFLGIKYDNPNLLYRLHLLRRCLPHDSEKSLSTGRLIEILEFENYESNFKTYTSARQLIPDDFVKKIKARLGGKTEVLSTDMTKSERAMLMDYCKRNKISSKEFLAKYGLNYASFKEYLALNYVVVGTFPFIDEMRVERDLLLEKLRAERPDISESELFDNYILICKQVYETFKDKIREQGADKILSNASLMEKVNIPEKVKNFE